MSGIYPEGGVSGGSAINAIPDLTSGPDGDLKAGCSALFFGTGCRVQFDPAQANAVISELENILRDRGIQYDCARLDNVSKAIGPHLIDYSKTVFLPVDPWPVKNGEDVIIQGSFTVPNTSGRSMSVLAFAQLTTLVKTLAEGNDENLVVSLKLSDDNSYDGKLLYSTIQMRRAGSTDFDSWQTVKMNTLDIPPGGRTFFYQMTSKCSNNLSFQLKEDNAASRWRFYGTSYLTSDIVIE